MAREPAGSATNNRLVRFPKYEFLIVFLPVAIVFLVGGYVVTAMNLESRFSEIMRGDRERLSLLRGFVGAGIKESVHHVTALSTETELADVLAKGDPDSIGLLTDEFVEFASRNPQYQQVRWIDERGVERVRVTRDRKVLTVTDHEDLQDKSGRYYVDSAAALLHGEVYISPIDLNMEHGRVEMPPRPVLRVAAPVFDAARKRRGSVVLNLSLNELFKVAADEYRAEGSTTLLLLNEEGTLLNVPVDEGDEAGLDFVQQQPHLWSVIGSTDTGHRETAAGFWMWHKLNSLAEFVPDLVSPTKGVAVPTTIRGERFALVLIAKRPKAVLMSMRRDSRILGSFGALLGVTVFGLAFYLYLAGHVRARNAQLAASEAMVRALRAEKEKELEKRFRTLVEASSVGQLVVDISGTILIANAAVAELLGYVPEELVGRPVEKLLPEDFRDRHSELRQGYLEAPVARKMGDGRIFEAQHKEGRCVAVEIGLNPFVESGQQQVLVNVLPHSVARDCKGRGSR